MLVFQNCDDEALLRTWRPIKGAARVLVLSKIRSWSPDLGVASVRLGSLGPHQSLGQRQGSGRSPLTNEDKALGCLSAELGGDPFAMHLAACRLRTTPPLTAKALLRQCESPMQHHARREWAPSAPSKLSWNRTKVLDILLNTLDPITEAGRHTRHVLARAACFSPGEPILKKILGVGFPEQDQNKALDRLIELGFLEKRGEFAVSMHPFTHAFLHRVLAEACDKARPTVLQTLLEATNLNDTNVGLPCLSLWSHLKRIGQALESAGPADFYHRLGSFMETVENGERAGFYYEKALALHRKEPTKDPHGMYESLTRLGLVLMCQERWQEAGACHEQAYMMVRDIFGHLHPMALYSFYNLGRTFQGQDHWTDALNLYSQALTVFVQNQSTPSLFVAEVYESLATLNLITGCEEDGLSNQQKAFFIKQHFFPKDRLAMADSYSHLGNIFEILGDYDRACCNYEQALHLRKQELGPCHPDTAESCTQLALLAYEEGQYRTSCSYRDQALAIYRRIQDENHSEELSFLKVLAFKAAGLGDFKQARGYFAAILAIRRHQLGKDHELVADTLCELGELHFFDLQFGEAIGCYQQAVAIRKSKLGEGHVLTADSCYATGQIWLKLGEGQKGLASFEEALVIYGKARGDHFAQIAACLVHLSQGYKSQQNLRVAHHYGKKALLAFHKALGENDPQLAKWLNFLGRLEFELKDFTGARRSLEQALAIQERVLREDHWDIARTLFRLGLIYQSVDANEALAYLKRALKIQKEQLGKDDEEVAETMVAMALTFVRLNNRRRALAAARKALEIVEKGLEKGYAETKQLREFLEEIKEMKPGTFEIHEISPLRAAILIALMAKTQVFEDFVEEWMSYRERQFKKFWKLEKPRAFRLGRCDSLKYFKNFKEPQKKDQDQGWNEESIQRNP